MLWVWTLARAQAVKTKPDRGDGILPWVITTALLAAAAIAIVAIIVTKAKTTASNVNTQ